MTCNKIITSSLITDNLTSNNLITTTEINSSNITSADIDTHNLHVYNALGIGDMSTYPLNIMHVKIQIRDIAENYKFGVESEGYAFVYNKILRFFMCICTIPSNMTGWTKPLVRVPDGDNLTIYGKYYGESDYSIYQLKYIVGQYYSTLNVGTIFQYSNVSRYDNRVYRDSSGAIFPIWRMFNWMDIWRIKLIS